MRALLIGFLVATLAGCQITDKRAESFVVSDVASKPKKFILLGAGEYEGELTLALVQNGFSVKPIAVTRGVTELETPKRLVEYKDAGYQFALKLAITHDRLWGCAFSGAHRVSATMSVIDLASNETLAVVKQVGPDGSCPPLSPVWPLLAKELARVWK
jgi:hypothetical protein